MPNHGDTDPPADVHEECRVATAPAGARRGRFSRPAHLDHAGTASHWLATAVLLSAAFFGCYLLALVVLEAMTAAHLPLALLAAAAVAAWALAGAAHGFSLARRRSEGGTGCWRYRTLIQLIRRLSDPDESSDILCGSAETIARALALPYVAVECVEADGRAEVISSRGSRTSRALRMPISYQGARVGTLVLGNDRTLSPGEYRLLDDLASALAVAAHGFTATRDLRRSRHVLMQVRHEERRKVHRDLHDGLGPMLATVIMRIDTVCMWLRKDPARAETLLRHLQADTKHAAIDVRRIIHELRSPGWGDGGGLTCAIHAHAARARQASGGRLKVCVDVPEHLGRLPRAVELAADRITGEALTNVLKHAHAGHCRIRATLDRGLRLEIADDGQGLDYGPSSGLGLQSMRERAQELGGECRIEPAAPRGTRVSLYLPPAAQDTGGGADATADRR